MPTDITSITYLCPCGTGSVYAQCCAQYINKTKPVPTALALMRSRYTAYALHNATYVYDTTATAEQKYHSKTSILEWARSNTWIKLEIINASDTIVEFKAYYLDDALIARVHHERSVFVLLNGLWYYKDGVYPSG